jgi:hypothetical protein
LDDRRKASAGQLQLNYGTPLGRDRINADFPFSIEDIFIEDKGRSPTQANSCQWWIQAGEYSWVLELSGHRARPWRLVPTQASPFMTKTERAPKGPFPTFLPLHHPLAFLGYLCKESMVRVLQKIRKISCEGFAFPSELVG